MSDQLDTKTGWLDRDTLDNIRANVPLVYVDAVPVRVDDLGQRHVTSACCCARRPTARSAG